MAVLLGNTVWEGNSVAQEAKPTYAEGARDGHFYKELDTGETYTVGIVSKTTTGFTIKTRHALGGVPASNVEVGWLVTRNYNP